MAKDKHEIPAPRENPTLFGHHEAEQRFIHEYQQGLTHHAYLMTGHKGIGKATLAYRFARFLLAQGMQKLSAADDTFSLFGDAPAPAVSKELTLQMSPDEPLFRRIAAGSHTDMLTISPAYDAKKHVEKSTISVDEARKVPEFLSLTPAEGDWRVVIVDAVDQLTIPAANALLKILEEPPANSILLLICHAPAAILPTIRSRCRTFKLQPPDVDAFSNILNHIAPHIEGHDYAALYALSHGAPGHAITLQNEHALECYEGWLAAMQPNASAQTRQQFSDSHAMRKSPDAWATLMHCWRMAVQRVSVHPFGETHQPIFRREPEMLEAIANHLSPPARRAWVEQGNRLIHETETYNLDKRYTIRLLADPSQLDRMAA